MHIAYVTHGLPFPGNNGVPMLGWALVKRGLEEGHEMTVIGLCPEGNEFCTPENETLVRNLGAKLVTIYYEPYYKSHGKRNIIEKTTEFLKDRKKKFFPTILLKNKMRSVLEEVKPDAIVAIHIEALAALHGLKTAPCLGIMGDPTHLPLYFRWRCGVFNNIRDYLKNTFVLANVLLESPRYNVSILKNCLKRGALAAHDAEWFRRQGIADCEYFRVPIQDEIGSDWKRKKINDFSGKRHKIILLGGLQGTATRIGLNFFAKSVFPVLLKTLGSKNFEVHIIGSGKWPQEVPDMSQHESVKVLGYVENIADELLSADVLLVPTPVKLGIRVRVLTGLSYGLCIVAHSANKAGIPELEHRHNCLLADSGLELAKQIITALKDKSLRETLGANARWTYEQYFSEKTAAGKMLDTVESMVKEPVLANTI